ncbi:MAG: hypothetical protein WC205_18410 [Opitutaceae bacterium]|jgi:hypothetical protein
MEFPSLKIDEQRIKEECGYPSKCAHPEKILCRRDDKNGNPRLYNQCQLCGEEVGTRVSAKGIDSEKLKTLIKFDEELKRSKWASFHESYRKARLLEQNRLKDNWNECYNRYLKHPEWRAKRKLVLERAQHLCEGCRTASAQEVHHTTYKHIGNEFLFELVAMCKPCHDRLHSELVSEFLAELYFRGFSGPSIEIDMPQT